MMTMYQLALFKTKILEATKLEPTDVLVAGAHNNQGVMQNVVVIYKPNERKGNTENRLIFDTNRTFEEAIKLGTDFLNRQHNGR